MSNTSPSWLWLAKLACDRIAERWRLLLVYAVLLACVAGAALFGCQTKSIGGGYQQRNDGGQRQQSETNQRTETTNNGANESAFVVLHYFDQMGRLVAEFTADYQKHQLPVTTTATTRESVTATTGPSQSTEVRQPEYLGGEQVKFGGLEVGKDGKIETGGADPAEVDIQAKTWGWIMPVAGILCFIAGGVLGIKFGQPAIGAVLAAVGAMCWGYAYLSPIFAVLIGVGALAGLLALLYWLKHREDAGWKATLPGIAKLFGEGKPNEGVAALRASTPELDEQFNKGK